MKKKCIIICGGGGKTTLYNKFPTLFFDIDDFICEDGECFNFWENTLLKPDTLLYSHDGINISYEWNYSIEEDFNFHFINGLWSTDLTIENFYNFSDLFF